MEIRLNVVAYLSILRIEMAPLPKINQSKD